MSFCDSTFVLGRGQETGYMLLHEIIVITLSLKLKVCLRIQREFNWLQAQSHIY